MDHFAILIGLILLVTLFQVFLFLHRHRYDVNAVYKKFGKIIHSYDNVYIFLQEYFTALVTPAVQLYTGLLVLLFVLSAHFETVDLFWKKYIVDVHELDLFFLFVAILLIGGALLHLAKYYIPQKGKKKQVKKP